MLQKLRGSYHFLEVITSCSVGVFLIYINFLFYNDLLSHAKIREQDIFVLIFVDIILLLLISLPYLNQKIDIKSEKFKSFFSIKSKNVPIRYDDIINFISSQALASFLIVIGLFTGKEIFLDYGPTATAFYIALFFVLSMLIAAISLLRLIFELVKLKWYYYSIYSVISIAFLLFIIDVSTRMA